MAHITNLTDKFPCRNRQLQQLYSLYGYKDEPYPPCVYVYGGPGTGKTTILAELLKTLKITHAFVNLIECYTTKILFETILNQLTGHKIDPKLGTSFARCENLMDFISHILRISQEIDLNGSIIVLDKAEQLRNMEANLLPSFMRLAELTGVQFSTILVSEIIFEKYYSKPNIVEPIKICFPQYNKDELLEILSLDFDQAVGSMKVTLNETPDFTLEFYKNYLNIFLSVFYRACRDLNELRYMSRKNFSLYYQPILDKKYSTNDSMALWRHIAPMLKNSLQVLYLRTSTDATDKETLAKSVELPFYAKYLLVAAYLASYNSVKDDKRLFMKYHGKKTKTMKDVKMKSKVSEQLNTQLGPKPFTLDRLLAIFYAILDDKVGFNNNLLVQISSLVELQLLHKMSENYCLDGQKYKCNVNFDFIQRICKMVGFNIRKYLSDFSHM